MRTTHVLSTIAATLLLSAGAASADGVSGPVKPERAPAALQNAPAEKIAPKMNAGERGSAETTGQGSTHALKPGSGDNAKTESDETVGAGLKSKESGTKSGLTAEGSSETKSGAGVQEDSKSGSKTQLKGAATNDSGASSKSATQESDKSGTTGQGAAASASKLTTEQRTKITTVIKKQKVEPVHLNVSLRIGTHIPTRVRFQSLPVEVVEVYPEWRGYDFIVVGDQIVIIDPDTRVVVYILET